uniref:Uncharacterized protein n=1 Tax=Anguilla anguilla TaxID=7936 RepID=A0A0E9PI30_ANGAN
MASISSCDVILTVTCKTARPCCGLAFL